MEYALIALTAVNSLLLIGIAGSLAKLIRYNQVEQDSKEEWEEILKSRRNLDKQKRSPNYSETSMVASNWDGIQSGRNWDGIPNREEQ
jgi:hypothetical protein